MTNMPKRISKEKEQLIEKLFGEGLIPAEITRRTNVSYGTVCGYTSVRQRINPETGNPFASLTEYREHLAKQRINPKTGERFASRTEYEKHLARQRQQKPINQKLSELIKIRLDELGKTQRQVSNELGITESAVSRYISGRCTPRRSLQEKFFEILGLPYRTLD